MNDSEERAYTLGERATWHRLMSLCLRELAGGATAEQRAVHELESTRFALRILSEKLGCNGWPDTEFLSDVVAKFVMPAEQRERAALQVLVEAVLDRPGTPVEALARIMAGRGGGSVTPEHLKYAAQRLEKAVV